MSLTKNSTTDEPQVAPDPVRIAAFWAAHVRPGDVHEIRIPKPKRGGPRRFWGVLAGYFDDPLAVVAELGTITGYDAAGAYCTLNPVLPDLLARARNRLVATDLATADDEIPVLRRLLVDIDARHPRGVCATKAERAAAIELRDVVRQFLWDELSWPEPEKVLRTGNGAALHYLLPDLPNAPDVTAVLAACLSALSTLFVGDAASATATVDTTTFNPSRLTRVAGTVNALGDGIPARPWRIVTAACNPAPVAVSDEQLAALAGLAPDTGRGPAPLSARPGSAVARAWDVRQVLREAGIVFREKPFAGGTVFPLDRCLTSSDHTDGAAVFELATGALAYRCHHATCTGKGWHEAKQALSIPAAPIEPRAASLGRAAFRGFEFRDGKVVGR